MKKIESNIYFYTYEEYEYCIAKVTHGIYYIYTNTKTYGHCKCATAISLEGCERVIKEFTQWRIENGEWFIIKNLIK